MLLIDSYTLTIASKNNEKLKKVIIMIIFLINFGIYLLKVSKKQ